MAKQGMKRPERTHTKARNDAAAVPEIQGKAKHGKEPVNPIVATTHAPAQKVFHQSVNAKHGGDRPIPSDVYPAIDNDLARDNIENDLPAADLQDL